MPTVEKEWKLQFHEWSTKYIVDWKQQYDNFMRTSRDRCGETWLAGIVAMDTIVTYLLPSWATWLATCSRIQNHFEDLFDNTCMQPSLHLQLRQQHVGTILYSKSKNICNLSQMTQSKMSGLQDDCIFGVVTVCSHTDERLPNSWMF